MRRTFAHEAILIMEPDGDIRAPGAAITVALCGGWEHAPPCRFAPHHSRGDRVGADLRIRTLFAAEPATESVVRHRIDEALAGGELLPPDGERQCWRVRTSGRSDVLPGEGPLVERLSKG